MSKDKTLSSRFHELILTAGDGLVNKIFGGFSKRFGWWGIGGWRQIELATRPVKDKLALFSSTT